MIESSLNPHARPLSPLLRPVGLVGRRLLLFTVYCGGIAIMAVSACRAMVRPRGEPAPLLRTTLRHVDRILSVGLPLVAIVFVGMGSFLAMQAYFGATFLDGIGPVVGVGLVRNLGPLMSGMILSGILAAKFTTEMHGRTRMVLDDEPEWIPDRDVPHQRRDRTEPARLVACRILAAAIAGPILGVWASTVGIFIGWAVARSMLGVTTPGFFDMFMEMLWVRDVVGVVIKGVMFGMAAAIYPCYEGLRLSQEHFDLSATVARAACLGAGSILFINSAWFLLVYHAGPAFGPTVLTPPGL